MRLKPLYHVIAMLGLLLGFTGCAVVDDGPQASVSQTRPASDLSAQLDSILTRHDTQAVVAARVVRVSDGAELYARNADMPMVPASNLKLTTSSATLDHFGRDHTFDTELYKWKDGLLLRGSGDPALGDPTIAKWHDEDQMKAFDDFAAALKKAGMTTIAGDLYYDGTAFDKPLVHPNWETDDLVYWYAAPVSGLNFNDNCIDVTAVPSDVGEPATLEVVPATTDTVHIVNLSETTEKDGENPDIERTLNATVYSVIGDVDERHTFKARPVTDPARFTADVLRTRLAADGITIQGDIKPFEGGDVAGEPIAVHHSAIADVLKRINTNSQNLFAEAMSKALGKDTGNGATWEGGNAAIVAFMEKIGIDSTGYHADDGSGLSHENHVTVRQLSDILLHWANDPDGDVFRESLSHAGHSGTLANRFKDAPGDVHGKTGYIRGVRALTVYATPTGSDETYIFSIIYNHIPGSVKPFELLQDEAVVALMKAKP